MMAKITVHRTIDAIPLHLSAGWQTYRAGRQGRADIARRQQQRLRDLVAYARTHSTYFAEQYRDVPQALTDITQLPTLTKTDLMSRFDEWMTDPAVHRSEVEAFIADPTMIGHDYLGRYVVCTTSGSTGTPTILMHDHRALAVYNALGYVRSMPDALLRWDVLSALIRGHGRLAAVFVTDGHFLGNTMMARRIRAKPWRARMQKIFSALAPVKEIVAQLNAFQPVVLGGYPSALEALASEQCAGRLHISPVLVNAAGETLTQEARRRIASAFGCRVGNYYGTSEAVGLTFECPAQRLHVNSDWYILEPVDEHDRPVSPGQLSHGALVTNLANRVQPIIRYQIGDQIALSAETCSCGSPFPTIDVIGRTDDTLVFAIEGREPVRVLPLAIATVAEETTGVAACQIIQRGPSRLRVRFRASAAEEEPTVWDVLRRHLGDYLAAQGAIGVSIERDDMPPQLHPRSGKFRQVYADFRPSDRGAGDVRTV
jgi:phenylacetate-coenzyme A ligase PaaK-like adenylate-forming protein